MAITPSDFSKIWASNADTPEYTFNEADYLKGWDFVGNLPPTRAQWNAMQKSTDEKMKYVFDNFGAPLSASTVAEMTMQNRVYVYTGSETGYTAGHWYYWNGSAWTDGGVYNAAVVQTDATLTQAGVPADAKATGDAIALKPNVDPTLTISGAAADAKVTGDNLYGDTVTVPMGLGTLVAGEAIAYDGTFVADAGQSRTNYIEIGDIKTIYPSINNVYMGLYAYDHTPLGRSLIQTTGYTFSSVIAKYFVLAQTTVNMNNLTVTATKPTRFFADEQTIDRHEADIDRISFLPLKPLICETKARCLWQREYIPPAWQGTYTEDGWAGNAWYKVSGITGNGYVTVESGGVASISDIAGVTRKIPMVISPDGVHYKTCLAWYIDATTIGVYPALDTTFSNGVIGALWADNIHLSKRGYIAFAQAMFSQNPKHCEKGSYIAKYDPSDGDTIPFVKIGNLYSNVTVINPWNDNWNFWNATRQLQYWMINSASSEQTSKKGIYWFVPTNGKKGYVEILIGGYSKTDFTMPTGYEIYIDVYQDGVLKESYVKTTNIVEDVCIDFDHAENILIEIYQNKYTAYGTNNGNGFVISSVFVWENQLKHGTKLIPNGSVVGQMFDSWGVNQNEATAKEFSRLINEATGVTVPYTNHSLGSQTSAWGKAWFYENVKQYNPSIALIDFMINDRNSTIATGFPATVAGPDGTLYDNLIDIDEYVANMNTLSNEARSNNIQLLIMPPDHYIYGDWYTKLCAEIE